MTTLWRMRSLPLVKQVWIQTFGCQMNVNDSEKMFRLLAPMGYRPAEGPDGADLLLLNTCSIREKPEQKVFSSLGRLKRYKQERPEVMIGVAGCMAQLMGEKIQKRAPYVDLVFGTYAIQRLPKMIRELEEKRGQRDRLVDAGAFDANDFDFLPLQEGDLLTRDPEPGAVARHLTIQNGCNKNCAYCIVPTVRGREISRPVDEIMTEARMLVEHGIREITLVGQTVNSYGKSSNCDFSDLLYKLNEISDLKRLRFVTSHPRDLNEKLMQAMAECDKVCEHLHLPLQSGSDRVLKRMFRGHTFDTYAEKIAKLREYVPNIALSSDFIVAFPGETEVDFQETLAAIETIQYDSSFSFIYSPRPFTKAADWPDQIDADVASDRLQRLQALQNRIAAEKLAHFAERRVEVLVEGVAKDGDRLMGRTRCHRIVNFDGPANLKGQLIHVLITKVGSHSLSGTLVHNKAA